MKVKKYLCNCFLLLIPILLWNVLLFPYLPEAYGPDIFWKDIPKTITYGENSLRVAVFALPAIMMLSLKTPLEKLGFRMYVIGVLIYFLSWLLLIIYPKSTWSTSLIGFLAPAFTPIFWLIGIGLIGNKAFFNFPKLTFTYIGLSTLFVMFHTAHVYLIFQRL